VGFWPSGRSDQAADRRLVENGDCEKRRETNGVAVSEQGRGLTVDKIRESGLHLLGGETRMGGVRAERGKKSYVQKVSGKAYKDGTLA